MILPPEEPGRRVYPTLRRQSWRRRIRTDLKARIYLNLLWRYLIILKRFHIISENRIIQHIPPESNPNPLEIIPNLRESNLNLQESNLNLRESNLNLQEKLTNSLETKTKLQETHHSQQGANFN